MEHAWSGSSDESLSDDDERGSASDSHSDHEQQPYWTREAPIIKAAYTGDVETMRRELAAGAPPDQRESNGMGLAPIHACCYPINFMRREDQAECARLLLAQHPYLHMIAAAGGFRAYEKSHRQSFVELLAPEFPLLPREMVSHIVSFYAHTGYY